MTNIWSGTPGNQRENALLLRARKHIESPAKSAEISRGSFCGHIDAGTADVASQATTGNEKTPILCL